MGTSGRADVEIAPISVPGQATAGNADEWTALVVPFKAKVVAVKWLPLAAIVADATNFFTLTVRNRGAAGTGTVLPAQRAYSATNSTAFVDEAMTLSGTPADLEVAEGDVLTVEKLVTLLGMAMPEGTRPDPPAAQLMALS